MQAQMKSRQRDELSLVALYRMPVDHESRAPRCGSGPNCPLAVPPHSTKRPFPPATALPSPFPQPPWLFLQCSGRAQPGRAWARDPVAQGGGGGDPSNRHLGPDPYLGALERDYLNVKRLGARCTPPNCDLEVQYPPCRWGISVRARHHMEVRNIGCDTPLRYYLEKVLRNMGGISNWAVKEKTDRVHHQIWSPPPSSRTSAVMIRVRVV